MKLARLGEPGAEIPVVIDGGRYLDARSVIGDYTGAAFEAGAIDAISDAVSSGALEELAGAAGMRVGAPVARPGAVLCIGLNYTAHAAESGVAPPELPVLFLKTPNTVAGPFDAVDIPRRSTKTDWEVELAIVVGRRALYLESPAEAAGHIAGYALANDLSERDFQLAESGGQWSKGKSSPGFTPLGPWLVTPDEFDPSDARLRSWVNGEARQDSSTKDMIFDPAFIVWHLSQYLALDAGDVILTGTPEGVGLSGRFPYLQAGDVAEVEIDGLGRQRQVFGQA